jgi:RimJ/RimL family protein N-acetyltransferase
MLAPRWGHGYATEAARASLEWGFANPDIDELIRLIQPDNVASKAVAARIGEHVRGEIAFHGGTTGLWAVTRAKWAGA